MSQLFVTVFYSVGVTGAIKYHDLSDQLLHQPRLSTSRSTPVKRSVGFITWHLFHIKWKDRANWSQEKQVVRKGSNESMKV